MEYWICSCGVLVCSSSQAILRLVNSRSKPDGRDITNLRRLKLLGVLWWCGVLCFVFVCVCIGDVGVLTPAFPMSSENLLPSYSPYTLKEGGRQARGPTSPSSKEKDRCEILEN